MLAYATITLFQVGEEELFLGKTWKLNAERNNGRAAMLGVTGCLIHELLGVDALFPTGGMSGAAPPTIF